MIGRRATVDIVIPVYNEERVLEQSIAKLTCFLERNFDHEWNIVIADNASSDSTPQKAIELSKRFPNVSYIRLSEKGRGRALREAWMGSKADIVSYMDVDLSTNLESFPKLISLVISGSDIAIGSRLLKDSNTQRCIKREAISRCYNLLLKVFFHNKFSDAQCGFKALTKEAADVIVPLIENNDFFFDSELLVLSEKGGYRIGEMPVNWIEDLDTKARIIKDAYDDVKSIIRLRFETKIAELKRR